jgi:hypothetical protein
MALPFPYTVAPDSVMIYGAGVQQSLSGVIPDRTNYKYGYVWDVGSGIYNFVYGNFVLFNEDDIKVKLLWNGFPYSEIEGAKLAGVDEAIP